MSTIPLKPGTTLMISGTYTYGDGSLSGVSITSDMVRGNSRVSLTCAIVDAGSGTFTASLTPAETASLAVGLWRTDIRFEDTASQVFNTDTYHIDVTEAITSD